MKDNFPDTEPAQFKQDKVVAPMQPAMSGLLPHYTVARTTSGTWACYKLTLEGYVRITLSYYSPADAAQRLEQYLRTHER